jgi:putative SOS response-associated peptidase YedK
MPLIIAAENYDAWLDPDNRDAAAVRALVRPYPDERMRAYPVSARVNTRAVDDASLIEPLADGPPQRDLL